MIPLLPKDQEYFDSYEDPILKLLQEYHFTNLNSTITWFGPMLYFFARAIEAHQILEIGTAEGYTSFYLAHAVKANGIRYQVTNGRFYGIDICQVEKTQEKLNQYKLPATILNLDSMLITPETFKDIKFDMIFQDGCHETDYVLRELEILYPQLKPNGYWIFHDSAGPAEEAWHKVIKDDRYKFEYIRFITPYGMSMMRKIEGVDPKKRFWI